MYRITGAQMAAAKGALRPRLGGAPDVDAGHADVQIGPVWQTFVPRPENDSPWRPQLSHCRPPAPPR